MEAAEFILHIIIITTFCIGVFGLAIQGIEFSGILKTNEGERMAVMLSHATLSAPCLTEDIDGESRRGIFETSKLDAVQNDLNKFCLSMPIDKWYIEVRDKKNNKKWEFGVTGMEKSKAYPASIPVAIKYSEDIIEPGYMITYVRR